MENIRQKYPGDDPVDYKGKTSLEESVYSTEESIYAGVSDTESG